MRTEFRLWLGLAFLLIAAPLLSACHTMRGLGEDISAAGHGLTHAAQKSGGN